MELRVHGVGGPTPESVLGVAPTDWTYATWRSEPSARSSVRRGRADAGLATYQWGPLTSGSMFFALWPLLLPFTLVNVAGWTQPRAAGRRERTCATIGRTLVYLVGLTVTCAVAAWVVLAGQVVARDQSRLPDRVLHWLPLDARDVRPTLGLVLAAVPLGLIVFASLHASLGYERYRPPGAGREPRRQVSAPSGLPRVSERSFFDDGRDHSHRWRWHAAVGSAATLVAAAQVVRVDDATAFAQLGDLVIGLAIVQLALLALVLVSDLAAGRRGQPVGSWLPTTSSSTAAIGAMLVGGLVTAGLSALVGLDRLPPGPALMLFDVYGWALGAGLVVACVVVLARLAVPLPVESGPRGQHLLPTPMARIRARLAAAVGQADRVIAVAGLGYVAGAVVAVAARYVGHDGADGWRLTSSASVNVARTSLLALLAFMVLGLVKSRANPESLRRVGNVWDVLTFWPRTFHPMAVRPYAERSVPELQRLLLERSDADLVVLAHSQGSVLVYAALLPWRHDPRLAGLRLLTMGSPLRSLYARAFPEHFTVADYADLRAELEGEGGCWTNLFRYTDHVGRTVFSDEAAVPDGSGGDVALGDPLADGGPVEGHNRYWDEPTVAVRAGRSKATVVAGEGS